MKIIRIGHTEAMLLYSLFLIERKMAYSADLYAKFVRFFYTTSGFYDKEYSVVANQMTTAGLELLKKYKENLLHSNIIVMNMSHSEMGALNASYRDEFYDYLCAASIEFRGSLDYSKLEDLACDRRVFLVSSFADLMIRQYKSGNMTKINPRFNPGSLSGYKFPYLYSGMDSCQNGLDAIYSITQDIKNQMVGSEVAVISCGPYATILSDLFDSHDIDVVCPGGDLQIFFGIAGKRWRKWLETQPLYLNNKDYWIDKLPPEYIPPQHALVEGGCYWL